MLSDRYYHKKLIIDDNTTIITPVYNLHTQQCDHT